MRRNRRKNILRRILRHEGLEQRSLLAGMVGDSPWQNPLEADDLNCDGSVSPADALVAINALNSGMTGALAGKAAPPALDGHVRGALTDFLDADGDGELSAADPLAVINALNSGLHRGKPDSGLPTTDQQPGTPGADAQVIDLSHNFAKVRAIINTDGDVDVFQVTPTKTELNVALFSSGGSVMSVSVVTLDDAGNVSDPLATATTEDGSHRPARTNLDVTPGTTYFLVVKGDAGVTGPYGLTVLNFTPEDFTPDSPLGTDIHPEAPPGTVLTLDHGRARVVSNIDTAGDKDVFDVTVVDGKLVVEAEAEFPLTVEVTDADGKLLEPITSAGGRVLVFNVTAGTYSISVAAANGTDTGPYHMNVVNALAEDHHHGPGDDNDDGPGDDHHGLPTPEELFAKIDTSDDDAISLPEFKAGVPGGGTPLADRIFAAWDANTDGALSLDEFVAGLTTLPPFLPHPHGHSESPLLTSD
jgi:Dockerin type I domain